MRRRLRRVGWWVRRLRGKRFVGFVLVVGAAVGAGWWYGGGDSAALGGVVALVAAGIVLARPVSAFARRVFLRTAPWRIEPGSLSFANADLGFRVDGFGSDLTPRQQVDQIVALGGRFSTGEIGVAVWIVATDASGAAWTLVQEMREPPVGKVAWTASIDGDLTIADFDEKGHPNPFRAVHRLFKEELDLPLVDIDLLGWGRDQHATGTRDMVVAVATTSMAAERISGFAYPASRFERTAHLVPVDLDGVAKSLGWGHPVSWRGAAAFGLLELLEAQEPGAWTALERRVAPRWREKSMFVRIERGTEKGSQRAVGTPS